MLLPLASSENNTNSQPSGKARGFTSGLLVWLGNLLGLGMVAVAFLPPESPYALSRSLYYADFRFWPLWISGGCWLIFLYGIVAAAISLLVPRNTDRIFLLRRAFFQTALAVAFTFFIWAVWYNHATTPLPVLFAPVLSPILDYIHIHYTLPLADYYTTGEGRSPVFWPTVFVVLTTTIFVTWRFWYHFKRWRKSNITTTTLFFVCLLPIILGADAPAPPPKVETSIGIYDVQSKDDLLKFSMEDIRELVRMEDDRTRGHGLPPHLILVYCFEEQSFQYTPVHTKPLPNCSASKRAMPGLSFQTVG